MCSHLPNLSRHFVGGWGSCTYDLIVKILNESTWKRSSKHQSFYCLYLSVWSNKSLNGSLIQSKKDGKNQEKIQSSTTPDPGYHIKK